LTEGNSLLSQHQGFIVTPEVGQSERKVMHCFT